MDINAIITKNILYKTTKGLPNVDKPLVLKYYLLS